VYSVATILADRGTFVKTVLETCHLKFKGEPFPVETRATAWRVSLDLLPAAGVTVRQFRWQVQTVQETRDEAGALVYEEAGDPSQVRTFTWLAPTPTPRPSPTPAP